jgi:hypothetical protein
MYKDRCFRWPREFFGRSSLEILLRVGSMGGGGHVSSQMEPERLDEVVTHLLSVPPHPEPEFLNF